MKSLVLITAVAALAAACTTAQPKSEVDMTLPEKEKAVALIRSIETGDPAPAGYIHPERYIQHNLAVGDGIEGFAAVLKQLPPGSAKAKVVRAFQDGDTVVTHTAYDFFGPKIGFDIFRFENGRIVEHWDNLQPVAEATASGRSQIDGPTAVTDLERTAANKALVEGFVADVLQGAHPEKITNYIDPGRYDQHNPAVADGLAALGKALGEMAAAGTPLTYTHNHMIVGQGNFVLAVSEGRFLGRHVAFYDLFRIEDQKIVEHWDTIEAIPPREQWKNGNGKF